MRQEGGDMFFLFLKWSFIDSIYNSNNVCHQKQNLQLESLSVGGRRKVVDGKHRIFSPQSQQHSNSIPSTRTS